MTRSEHIAINLRGILLEISLFNTSNNIQYSDYEQATIGIRRFVRCLRIPRIVRRVRLRI